MNDQPLVSVVIPCYNHEQFVQDCIQSVIDQTYQNIELIIIDDGSSDRSVEKIQEMADLCKQRFTRFEFRHRPNKGLSSTLNEAIEWCQGEYYSPIASDDIMLSKKIQIQVNWMSCNQETVALCSNVQMINEDKSIAKEYKKYKEYKFDDIFQLKGYLPACTQFIKIKYLREIGGYRKDYIIEDLYMWLKLSMLGKIEFITEYTAQYRRHDQNLSKNYEKMYKGRLQITQDYSHHVMYDTVLQKIRWLYLIDIIYCDKKLFLSKFSGFVRTGELSLLNIYFFKAIYLYFVKR